MRLNSPLITSFEYHGEVYSIDLSFDNVLDVFDVIDDPAFRDYEKAETNLELLLGQSFSRNKSLELWNYIFENFIQLKSKQPIEYDLKGNPMPTMDDEDDNRYIDFNQDAEYIYASFMQAYNINLFKQFGKLHWHEFKALLNGLPSDTIMQRIIQIRIWKPSKGESSEYKQNMRKLQKIYALNNVE